MSFQRGRDLRVSRQDVLRHVRQKLQATDSRPSLDEDNVVDIQPMTGMRGTIAGRMHEVAPDDGAAHAAHGRRNDQRRCRSSASTPTAESESSSVEVPGYTDYVIAAVAAALSEHRYVNSRVVGAELQVLGPIHVGMAVALDDGLVVPVVRNADRKSLADIAAATSDLASRARNGGLTFDELQGGTISVTTLGMFGVDGFTPVVNPRTRQSSA